MTLDGIENEREPEECDFDDFSDVDYDLDYTVQYQTYMHNESQDDKFNRGLDIFIESVMEPDHNLRAHAHEQKCYHELMYIREYVLNYLKTLRRP